MYFTENLKNWLMGKSEIDYECTSESPQDLMTKLNKTKDKDEISKINKKLNKLGYEVKTVQIISKIKQ
jgi:hypothetical protein